MKPPSKFELDRLVHVYDPAYARDYYLRTRKLKGRKKGMKQPPAKPRLGSLESIAGQMRNLTEGKDPRTGKTRKQISKDARSKQRKELAAQIQSMEAKLQKVEQLIQKKIREEASENRKSTAKKERAAKEKDKPKTAAEKAEIARENEKYRAKNQQKLKNQDKKSDSSSKSGGSSSTPKGSGSSRSVSDLESLATRVRGKIAVAKQKLAAL